jgi:hypothetical protein
MCHSPRRVMPLSTAKMTEETFDCHVREDPEFLRQIAERFAHVIFLPNDVDVSKWMDPSSGS